MSGCVLDAYRVTDGKNVPLPLPIMSQYVRFVLPFDEEISSKGRQVSLRLVIHADQHANELARQLLVMLIQPLRVGNQLDVRRLEARAAGGAVTVRGYLVGAAETQPVGRHAQPLGNHAQFFL